jgi:hypothetical protein
MPGLQNPWRSFQELEEDYIEVAGGLYREGMVVESPVDAAIQYAEARRVEKLPQNRR